MFSRKVPNTVLHTKPNLKSVILISNPSSKYYFFRYNFTIREITVSDVFKNISSLKNKMKVFIKDGMVLQALHDTFVNIPRTLRNQSAGVLRVWAHQCECVFAQRLRRSQQMFCLYTRLWEERALKELLTNMRQQITKRSKEFVCSAIGVAAYNWDNNRISTEEIINHMNELDYIHMLTEKTMICDACKEEQSDSSITSIEYYICPHHNSQRRTYDSWMPFIEKKDMIVWRREQELGHYEYKVYGSFDDVTAEDFLNVQIDSEYRKTWDTTAVTLEVVDKDPNPQSNSDVIYWEMMWPKLFANRDYVFNRRFTIDCNNKTIIIVSKGTRHPACPIKPDKYRVENYWSYMVIKPYTELDSPGIEFGLTYFDNPGVNIPAAVTTWVAMRAMPDFLTRLREATKDYKIYCEKEGSKYAYNLYQERKQHEKEQDKTDDTDEIIIDNTIFEPQSFITRKSIKNNKSPPKGSKEPDGRKFDEKNSKSPVNSPGIEVMTAPSPTVQADSDKHSYWKYLHPTYYFS